MNWIFKRKNNYDFRDEKVVFLISQRRNFSGKIGDNALIFDEFEGKWGFDSRYRIDDINVKRENNSDFIDTTIVFRLVVKFDEIKFLDYYKYSLRRITNFKYPHKHFIGQYNRIEEMEYEAIVKDKIFYSRTLFGSIVNNLHLRHRESFIIFISNKLPRILTSHPSLIEAIKLLNEYLKFAILKPSEFLKESYTIIQKLEANASLKVVFQDEEIIDKDTIKLSFLNENLQANSINDQVNIIDSQLNKLSNVLSELEGIDNTIEREFDKFFKNVRLPINLF